MALAVFAGACVVGQGAAPGVARAAAGSSTVLASPIGELGLVPATTVTGADDLWHNHAVTLRFVAASASAQVTSIDVRVDGGAVESYPGVSCRRVIAAPVDHSGDGEHVVEFRANDADGGVEDWQSVTVKIDTCSPTGKLLHAVGVMRSTTATIDFRIEDASPGSGATDVSIQVRTLRGKVVRRLALSGQTTGEDHVARFVCKLPRGFYRVRLTARDSAGNETETATQVRLVVMRWMRTCKFSVPIVADSELAYRTGTPLPLVDKAPHDSQGVRMYRTASGKLRNYPGGQARFGLANLHSYRLTNDVFYLERATAQAERLRSTHVTVNQAWFYPQRYTRYRHAKKGPKSELLKNPWYSGMAQGQVVSFMVAMYEATGESKYLTAAKNTLNTFLLPGPRKKPWVVSLDGKKRLWIQEWPGVPLDYTFNGHMLSSFGLYDYYRVTGDTTALLLFRAVSTATLQYGPKFRHPGHPSVYCLLHRGTNVKYHFVHVTCLKYLANFTGDGRFLDLAETLLRDYSGTTDSAPAARAVDAVAAGTDLTADGLQQSP